MDLNQFYTKRKEQFQKQFDHQRALLRRSSLIRLLVFLAAAASIYFLWPYGWWAGVAGFVGLVIFLLLVSHHEGLKKRRDHLAALTGIQETEINLLARKFHHLPDGAEFSDPSHEYSHDIDLFGVGSIYQYINRTQTADGARQFASLLNNEFKDLRGQNIPLNAENVKLRQEAIQELAGKTDYRHDFRASASQIGKTDKATVVKIWALGYQDFVPKVFDYLSFIVLAINATLIALYASDLISGFWVGAGFFLGLAITGKYLKQINAFSAQVTELEQFFAQYGKLIAAIEQEDFVASLNVNLKKVLLEDGSPVSHRLTKLGKLIGKLDQRNNMLFGVLANGLGLWDLYQCRKIEQWLEQNRESVPLWLSAVAHFEALQTCGNHAFNHPDHTYAGLKDGEFTFQAQNAYHLLLDPAKAVGNTIEIDRGEFFIITGANMAGKSTFLRTVSTQIVLSNIGLPICAKNVQYTPIHLITSMRTSDSLSDEASYFFSELSRLKFIIDRIEEQPYFIVLDEILKGTNSQDKANGSRELIEKLSRKRATGIIATHDLSLTEVADEFEQISNYYFDADITNDELTFDYTMKAGVATNMNASFLLRKMGIVDK
jgi:ABC-type lipoprotein export system ATPase subunit